VVDDKVPLYPNKDAILPRKLTFKYFKPAENIGPKNIPERELKPGRWVYYDVDLNAIRESVS